MGRMETIWGDPLVFRPERFLEDSSVMNAFSSVPFSGGSRNCIGQKFALMEMKTVVSKVLRNFEILVPSSYEPVIVAELILRPQNGIMLEFRQRKSLS